jgi:hypothetical protein
MNRAYAASGRSTGPNRQHQNLAYTINYAADVPPDAGMAYRGIFGGYRGFFSTIPYLKVRGIEISKIEISGSIASISRNIR